MSPATQFALVLAIVFLLVACQSGGETWGPSPSPSESMLSIEPDESTSDDDPHASARKRLDPFVGTFEVEGRMFRDWADPDAGEKRMTVGLESRWILNDRFVHAEYESHIGKPGEEGSRSEKGMSLLGYNPTLERYEGIIVSDVGPGIAEVATGFFDEEGNTLTLTREFVSPAGGIVGVRKVMEVLGPDEHTVTVYRRVNGELEKKVWSGTWTRVSPNNSHSQ